MAAFGDVDDRSGAVLYPSSRGVEFMRPDNDPRGARSARQPGYEDAAEYGEEYGAAAEPAASEAYGAAADYGNEPSYAGAADHARDQEYARSQYARDADFPPASEYGREAAYLASQDARRGRYAGARDEGPEPARGVEYSRSRTRGPTATATRNGDADTYSGYPTAARLLGITPPPSAADFDDAPEPGKWERSGRLQPWLEDAEQTASAGRVSAMQEVEELQAGVMPARAMQARRAPAAPLRPVTRNNARKALPWERRAAEDGYPQVRPAQSARRIPPVLIATLVVLIAAGVLFSLPSMLPLVASTPRKPAAAQPTARATQPAAVVAPATPEPTVAPAAAPTPRIYRVQSGDNLSGIASRFKVTVKEILTANPDVTDPAQIKIGQRLTIPIAGGP
jgi:LysM repeat protein